MIIQMLKTDGDTNEVIMLSGKDQYVIGREEGDLVLGDERCSRKHAMLFVTDDLKVGIRDLKSTNGTIVNKQRVPEAILSPEDTFRLGRTIFIYFGCQEESDPFSKTTQVKRTPVDLNDVAKPAARPRPQPVAAAPAKPAAKAPEKPKRPASKGPLPEVMSSAIDNEALRNLPEPPPLGSILLNQWPDNFRALQQDNLLNFVEHLDEDQKQKSRRLVDYATAPKQEDDAA